MSSRIPPGRDGPLKSDNEVAEGDEAVAAVSCFTRMPAQPNQPGGPDENELALVRAVQRDGPANAAAWTALLAPYQRRLYAVCFRMVNDRDAAADLTQDSFVKIIQGLPGYDGRSKLSTWMIRIAMNTCLSYLRAQKHRRHASLDSMMDSPRSAAALGVPAVGGGEGVAVRETGGTGDALSLSHAGSSGLQSSEKDGVPSGAPSVPQGDAAGQTPQQQVGSLPTLTSNAVVLGGSGRTGNTGDWREQTREQTPADGVELTERRGLVAQALRSLPADQRAILVLRDVQDLDYDQIAEAMGLAVGTVKSRLFRARVALREAIEGAESGKGENRGGRVPPAGRMNVEVVGKRPPVEPNER